jgi:predicted transcriptional regulator
MDKPEQRRIISAQVEPELAYKLERLARDNDRTLSSEIRRACREHVGQQDEADRLQALYRTEGEQR